MKNRVIAWWSGGISSALACLLALKIFKNVVIVFIDTKNEDEDTYRFMKDCEDLYGQKIEIITSDKFESIDDVWNKYLSLNTATGAICSTHLKREVRQSYQNLETDYAQIFGFDVKERKRHINMRNNYPELNVISPLIDLNLTKEQVVKEFELLCVKIPRVYEYGFRNNNCFNTGCVQGGIGYWKKIEKDFPEKFKQMGDREHKLSDLKGKPVTICKDQSKGGGLVFLIHNPLFPEIKDLSMMKGREVESLVECNGFCSTKD